MKAFAVCLILLASASLAGCASTPKPAAPIPADKVGTGPSGDVAPPPTEMEITVKDSAPRATQSDPPPAPASDLRHNAQEHKGKLR